jgi:hypothetical protein
MQYPSAYTTIYRPPLLIHLVNKYGCKLTGSSTLYSHSRGIFILGTVNLITSPGTLRDHLHQQQKLSSNNSLDNDYNQFALVFEYFFLRKFHFLKVGKNAKMNCSIRYRLRPYGNQHYFYWVPNTHDLEIPPFRI